MCVKIVEEECVGSDCETGKENVEVDFSCYLAESLLRLGF